jgi:hypothetical protein
METNEKDKNKINKNEFLRNFYKIKSSEERFKILMRNKWLFASGGNLLIKYPNILMPNTTLTQNFGYVYSPTNQVFTTTTNILTVTIPYKVSFTINNTGISGGYLALCLGVRDVQTTPVTNPGDIAPWPDVGVGGNYAILGNLCTGVTTTPTCTWISIQSIPDTPAPQANAIYTIYESAQNVLTYNVNDSVNFNNNNYSTLNICKTNTPTLSSFNGTTRNIFIYGYANTTNTGSAVSSITMVNSIN